MGERAEDKDLRTVGTRSTGVSATDHALSTGSESVTSMVVPSLQARRGEFALPAGFLAFGLMLGHLTGFSMSSGISQVMLTSLFTFVGGVLLSYAGLRKYGSGSPDPRRVGVALGCFALAVILGTPAGVYMRCNKAVNGWFLGEVVQHSQCAGGSSTSAAAAFAAGPVATQAPTSSGVGAMAIDRTKCVAAQVALSQAITDEQTGRKLDELLHDLLKACNLSDR